MQSCAEKIVPQILDEIELNRGLINKNKKLEAGLVAIEPYSGLIKTWDRRAKL